LLKTQVAKPTLSNQTPNLNHYSLLLIIPMRLDFNISVLHLRTDPIIDNKDFTVSDQRSNDYMNPEMVLAVTCHGKKPLVLGGLAHCVMLPTGRCFSVALTSVGH
jgi:hypothetical protein